MKIATGAYMPCGFFLFQHLSIFREIKLETNPQEQLPAGFYVNNRNNENAVF
jgi:hypothetical protein